MLFRITAFSYPHWMLVCDLSLPPPPSPPLTFPYTLSIFPRKLDTAQWNFIVAAPFYCKSKNLSPSRLVCFPLRFTSIWGAISTVSGQQVRHCLHTGESSCLLQPASSVVVMWLDNIGISVRTHVSGKSPIVPARSPVGSKSCHASSFAESFVPY